MRYEIYVIKNRVNEKVYVGQTTAGIGKRWGQHKADARKKRAKLYNAMRKYGVSNFYIEKICSCKNMEELNAAEEFLITCLDTVYNGYNTLAGGLNYERPIDTDKLALRVWALLNSPPTKENSIRKFKVLLNLIQILLTLPDVPVDEENVCDISEEEKRILKQKMNKLWRGWPGERVSAAFILFAGLCAMKGFLNGQ